MVILVLNKVYICFLGSKELLLNKGCNGWLDELLIEFRLLLECEWIMPLLLLLVLLLDKLLLYTIVVVVLLLGG